MLWYALADTQWKWGRLIPGVKEKALYYIENGGGIELFDEETSMERKWSNTLQKLKSELESEMPSEKRIPKVKEFTRNPWNVGDIYVYQFHSQESKEMGLFGKYIPIQKIADEEWYDGIIISRIQVFDEVFDRIPALEELVNVDILPFDISKRFFDGTPPEDIIPICMNGFIAMYKAREYQKNILHLSEIGKMSIICRWRIVIIHLQHGEY